MSNDALTLPWQAFFKIEEIPILGARVIQAPVGPVAIFRNTADEIFAVLDECPHKGGPLSQGIVHGQAVTCPLHSWNIDLSTGCAIAPDQGCAQSFAVKVISGVIWLNREELVTTHG